MKLVCLLLFAVIVVRAANFRAPFADNRKIRYDNYKVYKINFYNVTKLQQVELFQDVLKKYYTWKDYSRVTQDIQVMIQPAELENFLHLMHTHGIQTELLIPDVQQLIDMEQSTEGSTLDDTFGWTRYHNLKKIEAWMDEILEKYPAVTDSFTIGKSFEGRNIRGIKISYKEGNPGVFIESNIHAREWITSATATWFINELLTSNKPEVRTLALNHDWYIVPVFNVDGFVYSHEINRLWRKTRQPIENSTCIGADANRNFGSHWLENGGADSNPCGETYAGPNPFSEPETRALADYVTAIKDTIKVYISFHSFGQYLLSPYGHTKEEFPENHEDILNIGKEFTAAISDLPFNTTYTHGSTGAVLYIASGTSIDWVFNTLDVKVSFTIEFRDKGKYGFVLPPVQILPNCEELMAGMLALIAKTEELGYM